MTEHLDRDALADVLGGGSPPDHLGGCADCTTALDELGAADARVRAALAGLPDPELPPGLAERLAAAIAAEGPATALPQETTLPAPVPIRSRGPARWLPAAAAAVLLLGGAAFGVSQLGGGGSGDDAGSAAGTSGDADKALEAGVVRNDSGNDYLDRAALAAAVPALLSGAAQRSAADSMVAAAPPPAAAGGASAPASNAAAPMAAALPPDPLSRLRQDPGLADCLLALLPPEDPSLRPLALDYASYKGTPAMIVLLPGAVVRKIDVFVVGAGCSRADDSLLFYTSVDAP